MQQPIYCHSKQTKSVNELTVFSAALRLTGTVANSKHWFSYTIGSRKLSANEQFFVGAQTVVSLLQTTQIKQGMSFIAASKVYTSANKTTIVSIETELFLKIFFTRGGLRLMFTCALWR